jgi:rhamnose transport system substrate-binding protein
MIPIPNLSRNLAVINTSLQRGASAAGEEENCFNTFQFGARIFRTSILLFSVFSVISCLILSLLLTGCSKSSSDSASSPSGSASKKLTIALMPKSKGNAYFISCKQGADEAAKELGVELLFDGPTDPDPAKQNEIIENWITLGVDAIAAACENKEGISTALRKAKQKGIKVLTYDSDANPDARDFFVNQATPEGIGNTLMDEAARLCNDEGEFAIITASLTAANMNEWQKYIEARRSSKYPNMKMVALRPCDDLKDKAQSEATALLSANPNLKLIMAICSPAVPGAAEAVKQAGKTGTVKVIGLGLPSENRKYVKDGVTQSVILWKTIDLGYLTIHATAALAKGELKPGATTYKAGRLGEMQIQGDNILLGQPFVFNKENIDQFNF